MKFSSILNVGLSGFLVLIAAGTMEAAGSSSAEPESRITSPKVMLENSNFGEQAKELLKLAITLRDQGKSEEAMETLERVRAIGEEHHEEAGELALQATELMGTVLTNVGRNREAAALLPEAGRRCPLCREELRTRPHCVRRGSTETRCGGISLDFAADDGIRQVNPEP